MTDQSCGGGWDQAMAGPAAGQRSYSMPVRRPALCEADQYMSDLPEVRCSSSQAACLMSPGLTLQQHLCCTLSFLEDLCPSRG